MRYTLIALIVFFCVSSIGFADASCISMKIAKASYLPQETLQLEIDADVSYGLTAQDISLYRNSTKLPTAIFLSKISATKWFSWADLPNQAGDYTIKIKGTCKDGRIYTEEKTFEVLTPLAIRYENFKSDIGTSFEKLPLETHILAAGALSADAIASEALKDYAQRSDSCLNSNCTTKNLALTLVALKDSLIKQKMYSQLLAYQDYARGLWQLQLNSSTGQNCSITIADVTATLALNNGTNFINVTFASPRLDVECEQNISGKIVYSYNEIKRQFEMQKIAENKLAFTFDSGCWGTVLKSSCDSGSTAYALLAFALTQHDQNESSNAAALEWLKGNISSTEEKAILYFLAKDPALLVGILNDQAIDGWWPKKTLYEPDPRATALVIFALKHSDLNDTQTLDAMTKAETWLRSQNPKLSDEAFTLFFAFPSSDIEPTMTFWPGIIKTQTRGSFDLMLTNKGATNIEVNATLLNSTTPISLSRGEIKKIHFNVPIVATLDARTILENLALDYRSSGSPKSSGYSIPVIILTEKASQEYIGNVTSNESAINASQQQIIIDAAPSENKTVDINLSLFGDRFKFVEQNITLKAATADKTFTRTVKLSNLLDKDLTNVEISPSITLQTLPELITISPSHIDKLSKDETVNITLQINPAVMPQSYKGLIQATAYYDTAKMNTTLTMTIDITHSITELQNCSEMNGTVCASPMQCSVVPTEAFDTSDCCVPSAECKKTVPKGRTLGVIVVAVIIILLLVVLFIFRKKPKKEMKEFLEESTKVYEKKFQRPPSISH